MRFKLLFLITLFCVSFISDVILNDLTRKPLYDYHNGIIIKSLGQYFSNKSIVEAGLYAGLTVIVGYLLVIIASIGKLPTTELVYSKTPSLNSIKLLGSELALAFFIGYLLDIIIDKTQLFGKSLNPYYSVAGSGLWGGTAFVVAIVITYLILWVLNYLL